MVFQLFTSILASIVAFFGVIVPLNDDVKHWFADITVGKTLDTVLPADAHPVSAAELQEVRSGNWMSVIRPQTTTMFFGDYYRDAPKKLPNIGEEFGGNAPGDLQHFSGGASCNATASGVWFDGNVMHKTRQILVTNNPCPEVANTRDKDVQAFLSANPELYLDGQGHLYLKRPDGVASEWQRPWLVK